MRVVVDASVVLAWSYKDEHSPYADGILVQLTRDGASAPPIWPLEVANSILVALRKGRISPEDLPGALADVDDLPISIAAESKDTVFGPVASIAREQGISVYDASYVELALREGLPLATVDVRLREAAQRLGVALA